MEILIADDDAGARHMLEAMVTEWGYEATPARDGNEAWDVLQRPNGPPLAILDWMMPGMDGPALCRKIRQQKREPYVYILILSAKTEMEHLVEGMEAGADDYLTKPFDPNELKVRLRAASRIVDLQAELIATREALRLQVTRDALTGIWNRAAIFDIVRRELDRSRRENVPFGLVMMDLDRFKQVNDSYGHLAGDAVLRETARRITASIRSYDALGRYGGEEFLLVLPGCDAVLAANQAERMRSVVADEPFTIANTNVTVTCSMGVASTAESREHNIDSLIHAADAALYRAKQGGGNRVEL